MKVLSTLGFLLLGLLTASTDLCAQYAWRLILPRTAFTVQVNPLDANKLYVGNRYDQLWRSNDGGVFWERHVLTEFQSDGLMSTLHVSSADTNVVLAAGILMTGIFRSTDGGRTATRVLQPETGTMWFVSEAIVEDPSNPQTLYAVQGRPLLTGTIVYKSTDTGATWDSIATIDSTKTRGLCTIAIRPDSTNILFVGAKYGAIFRSDDYGHSFREVPVLAGATTIFDDSEIPKIVFSPTNPMVGYAVVSFANSEQIAGNGGLLKTTDGGHTWDRIAFADTSLWAVEVRESSLGTDDVFVGGFQLNTPNSVVPGDSLVARSLDGGQTWTRFNNITWSPNEDGDARANVWVQRYNKSSKKLYMATECGLYVFDEPVSVEESIRSHATLTASLTNGVLRVTDGSPEFLATTWTVFNMQGAAVATGPIDPSQMLALNVAAYAPGAYVLTWGNDDRFRTVSFVIVN